MYCVGGFHVSVASPVATTPICASAVVASPRQRATTQFSSFFTSISFACKKGCEYLEPNYHESATTRGDSAALLCALCPIEPRATSAECARSQTALLPVTKIRRFDAA